MYIPIYSIYTIAFLLVNLIHPKKIFFLTKISESFGRTLPKPIVNLLLQNIFGNFVLTTKTELTSSKFPNYSKHIWKTIYPNNQHNFRHIWKIFF